MKRMIQEGRILFGDDESKIIEIKVYARDYKAKLPSVIELDGRLGAYDIRGVFPETSKVFSNPKPVELIKELIGFATEKGDIILDFFAGSGTTAHAVLELAANGLKRSFILIQLPEPLDTSKPEQKAAAEFCAQHGIPPNIAALAQERIRRVCKAQSSEDNGQASFKAFRLSMSCFLSWDGAKFESKDGDLVRHLELHADHLRLDAMPEDILFELLMKDGFDLTVPIECLKLAEKDVFSVADGALLVCLDKQLIQEVIDAMADMEPSRVICLDAGFQGNDQLKANAAQTFKTRARNRGTAIEFRTV